MKLNTWCLALVGLLAFVSTGLADNQPRSQEERIKLIQGLKYQHGQIDIPGGVAKLNLPTNISYLDPNDSDILLVKIWNNPPSSEKTLGMLVPTDKTAADDDFWAVTITSTEDGYVKDNDAGKINYDDLLKQMQQGTIAANKERTAKGYPAVELIGWAEPPHYDAATHKLYWAEELKVDGITEHSLNYDIRILGRRGYLVLSTIAGINQLPEIRRQTPQILGLVEFNEGSRYTDFDPKVDKVATYGIAALVVGGIAAKLGLFKVLIGALVAAGKYIVIGVVALSAWARNLFKKRKDPSV